MITVPDAVDGLMITVPDAVDGLMITVRNKITRRADWSGSLSLIRSGDEGARVLC